MNNKKKILITKADCFVGDILNYELNKYEEFEPYQIFSNSVYKDSDDITSVSFDVLNKSLLKEFCLDNKFDVIVNTFEEDSITFCEENKKYAWDVNVNLVNNLISVCKVTNAKLITFSNELVYNGKNGPFTEEAQPNPISYLGKTKLAAENMLKISKIDFCLLRTSFVYGYNKFVNEDNNFIFKLINKIKESGNISLSKEHFTNPLHIDDFIHIIVKSIINKKKGYYNLSGADYLSLYDIGLLISVLFNKDASISDNNSVHEKFFPKNGGLINLKCSTDFNFKFSSFRTGLEATKHYIKYF